MADPVGSVSVDVVPDATGFKKRLDAKLKGLNVKIGVEADVAKMRSQIESATKKQRVKVGVDADTTKAAAKLRALARTRTAKVKVDADTSSIATASRNISGLTVAVAALGPALVPVTAAVAGLGAALVAPLAAAGGGLTIYGIIAGTALKRGSTKQVDKVKEAVERLGGAFDKMARSVGPALFRPIIKGIDILSRIMPKFAPVVRSVSGALSDMLGGLGRATRGPGFKGFMDFIARQAPPAIKSFGRILGNVAVGVGGLIRAFAPLGKSVLRGIERLTEGFADFGRKAGSNSGVQGFIEYVRRVGPKVAQFFGDLVTIAVRLGRALAPIGEAVMAGFGLLARLIKQIPIPVLTAIAAGILAIVTAMWAFSVASKVAMAGPIVLIIGALAALAVGLVYAYKKSETFRKIVNAAWRGIKKAAEVTWKWMKGTLWPGIKRVFGWIADRAKWLWNNGIKPAFNAISKFVRKELMPIIRRLWNKVIKPAFKGIATVIQDAWKNIIKPVLKAAWWFIKNVLAPVFKWLWKNVIKPVFRTIGKVIKVAWNRVIKPAINLIIDFVSNVLYPIFRKAYGVVKGAFKGIATAITWAWENVIQPALEPIKGIFEWIVDKIKWVLDKAGAVKDIYNKLTPSGDDGENDGSDSPGGIGGVPDELRNPDNNATGGYITRPTLSWVGEGKEAEAILPRSVLSGLMASAGAAGAAASGAGRGMVPAGRGELRAINPFGDGRVMQRTWKSRVKPTLEGFVEGAKRSNKASVGMELAVGKSSKKIGKYWTHLRKNDLGKLNKAWGQSFSREMPKRLKGFDSSTDKTLGRTGKTLAGFHKGPVTRLEKSWRTTMATDLPKSANTMDSRVRKTTGRTTKGLNAFSGVIRNDVPKAFRAGVDAIGGQWKKVQSATGKPIRSVVDVQLNKGLLAAFNKIAKFVDTKTIDKIELPKFATGSWIPGSAPSNTADNVTIRATPGEFMVRRRSAQEIEKQRPGFLERINKMGAKALPGHANGGFINPDRRVSMDGEPLSAIHAAQLLLANRLLGTRQHVMQGSWQPATSYSGTSHTGPGVADTGPGSFAAQAAQRRVGIAAWARNIPGAAYAGSGAHIHGVSLLSPGARSQGQRDDYLNGGDGLGGSDYGPRPPMLPNLREMLKRFGPLPSHLGGLAPLLPKWAQKIVDAPRKWARGLLDANLSGGFGSLTQGLLNSLIGPSADWATSALSSYSGGGVPGGPMPGPKQLSKASPALAKRYAFGRLKAFGFGKSQWDPLQKLWTRESGWRWNADNPSSSAYGIPQALPGSKMASAGANWYTNAGTQVNWGLGYIKGRYGNPANAWAHSESNGWYDKGGLARGIGLLLKNTPEPERVLAPRQTAAFEHMVARNFQPNDGNQNLVLVSGELDLTERSKVMLRGQARAEIGSQVSHARTTGRQWS